MYRIADTACDHNDEGLVKGAIIMFHTETTCPDNFCDMRDPRGKCLAVVCTHTTKKVAVQETKCYWCEELEAGDILYQHGSDDRGILFEEIRNVRYCPVCGKKLQEERLKWGG